MKIVFLVNGLGEYAQAFAVANAFVQDKQEIFFISNRPFLNSLILKDGFTLRPIEDNEDAQTTIDSIQPDALFLCNSHTSRVFNLTRPKQVKKVYSLDSNWLFNNKKYEELGMAKFSVYEWVDTIFCVFPHAFFLSNLKQNGGNYDISETFLSKIINPGFIPSGIALSNTQKAKERRKLGLMTGEKLILIYLSRAEFHSSEIKNHITEFERIISQTILNFESKVKIQYIDLTTKKNSLGYVFADNVLSSEQFDMIVSLADLFIMHYGYGTLPKLFHNEIPAICLIPKSDNPVHSNLYELKPCIDQKAIDYIFFQELDETILSKKIRKLLFDIDTIRTTKEQQKALFLSGEKNLLKEVYRQFSFK